MATDKGATNAANAASIAHVDDDLAEKELEQLAVDEAHDADIPSSIGYILDKKGEARRRRSIAEQRHHHDLTHKHSWAAEPDVEKHAGLSKETGAVGGHDKGDEEDEEEGLRTASPRDDEANIVFWDGPDDPANPYNWPTWRKVVNCGLISALTFITPLASCKSSPIRDAHAARADDSTQRSLRRVCPSSWRSFRAIASSWRPLSSPYTY